MSGADTAPTRSVDALSIAKATACFLVVLQHTYGPHTVTFHRGWWLITLVDSLTRVAVPTFVMATGAIFLQRTDGLDYFFRRRLLRIALPLLFWSLFFMVHGALNGQTYGNWPWRIVAGPPVNYHLWYFYALVGLSLIVPVLSAWFRTATAKEHWLLIVTWYVLIAVLPSLSVVGSGMPSIGFFPATGYAILDLSGYLILGATLCCPTPQRRHFALGIALYLGGSMATCLLTYKASVIQGQPTDTFYWNNSISNVVAAAGFFLAIQNVGRLPGGISKLVSATAACSLGIYGLHPLVLDRLRDEVTHRFGSLSEAIALPAIATATFVIAFAAIYVIRKLVPPLRQVM